MTTRSVLLLPILLSFTVMGCRSPAPEMAPLSEEDVATIRELEERWVRTVLAGDWESGAAMHTQDALWMPPNEPPVEGQTVIRQLDGRPRGLRDYSSTVLEIDGRDGLAYSRGTYTLEVEHENGTVAENGKYLHVLEKRPDGSWLFKRVIWSPDQLPSR